jgi:outer membrane protein OmpA-like peptidoglycan-associated protein
MTRRVWTGLGLLLWAAAAGCGGRAGEGSGAGASAAGGDEASPPAAPAGPARAAGGSARGGAAASGIAWEDPEPPGAQALAEEVLGAPSNADKTTRLRMEITTLVDTRTGIVGFGTAIAAGATSLDDRLSRLGAEQTATEVTIRLPGSVLFDFDSAAIRPDAERALTDVAEVLAAYAGRPARIEGHTDSIASDAYNQRLSERRAASVRDWLVAHGVAAARLTPAGLGETRPVADNATPAGRQLNRRVEVVIEKGG